MALVARQGQAKTGIGRLDSTVACFWLMQTIGGFSILSRTVYGEWDLKGGDKISQGLNLLSILTGAWLVFRAWKLSRPGGAAALGRQAFPIMSKGAVLALATGMFLLGSTLWSVDPDTSLRRGVLYLLFLMGVIGIAGVLDGDEFMQVLAVACAIPAVVSLILLAVHPASVEMVDGGGLRGVFSHKNVLGQVMAMGVLAGLHGLRAGRRRAANGAMLLAFVAAALASHSATSIMVIGLLCAVSVIVMLLRQGEAARMFGMFLALGLTLSAVVTAVAPDMVFELIGKDPTLTGRTELWAFVEFYIAQRPMLGWGLLAFWTAANPIAGQISTSLGWTVPQAHNGLLEMLLEIGVAGTALFVILLGRNMLFAWRCLATRAREFGVSSLLCYGSILLIGITEDVMTDPGHAAVGVFFITGLVCERAVRVPARRAVPAARPGLARGAPVRR